MMWLWYNVYCRINFTTVFIGVTLWLFIVFACSIVDLPCWCLNTGLESPGNRLKSSGKPNPLLSCCYFTHSALWFSPPFASRAICGRICATLAGYYFVDNLNHKYTETSINTVLNLSCQNALKIYRLNGKSAPGLSSRMLKLPLLVVMRRWWWLPSVHWHCWLGSRKGIRPVKNRVVGCWCGCLSGARCRHAYGPADATATHCLLLQ